MLARMFRLAAAAALLASTSPALAGGASNFTLVNGTGAGLSELSIPAREPRTGSRSAQHRRPVLEVP